MSAADTRRVRRAAFRVALSVAAAAFVIIGIITAVAVAMIVAGSRPDDRGDHHDQPWRGRVVDVGDIVPVMVILAALGVVALAVIAWFMARRAARPLTEALRVQRAFVADASHELRTPLTALTSRIELAQHRAGRGGDVPAALADARGDAAVMDAVLTDLLLASEAAGGRAGDANAVADVRDAASSAGGLIHARAAAAGVGVHIEVAPGLRVAAEGTALTRALLVLLDNAVRHSPRGGRVTVSAALTARSVRIRVSDQGGGVVGVDPAHLFDRFVRAGDAAPGRGFGLGLALVRDIAERFSGSVALERTGADGTTFVLVLPAVTARTGSTSHPRT